MNYRLIVLLMLLGSELPAQDVEVTGRANSGHQARTERLQSQWGSLIPKQSKLQYAGSMGFLSGGVGWYYGKKNQWETDIYLGFIPRLHNRETHMTATLKQTYTPWRLSISDRWRFEPLTTGVYINKIFGENLWSKLPEKYPQNYYFWTLTTRLNVFAGQALVLDSNRQRSGREFAFFYELSTNDLYLISAVGNKTIGLTEILGLSLGFRYRFM